MEDKYYKYLNGERMEIVGEELEQLKLERIQEAARQAELQKVMQENLLLCSEMCNKIAFVCNLSEAEKEHLNKIMSK